MGTVATWNVQPTSAQTHANTARHIQCSSIALISHQIICSLQQRWKHPNVCGVKAAEKTVPWNKMAQCSRNYKCRSSESPRVVSCKRNFFHFFFFFFFFVELNIMGSPFILLSGCDNVSVITLVPFNCIHQNQFWYSFLAFTSLKPVLLQVRWG